MRYARLMTIAILSAVVFAGCASASAGWTYAPASTAPRPSSVASVGPGGSSSPNLVTISALGFKYEQATATAPAGKTFQVAFENKDAGVPHNISLHQGGATGAELFKGTIFNGIATRTYDVPALDAGTYAFVCTVHPTMVGTLTVQ